MLQQTQIATVLERGFYSRWMEQFPDVNSLAVAREEDVLKAWEGLGYYRRARNLQRLAQVVVEEHKGRLPQTVEGLKSLPGIGPYTAGAVASFAFDLPAPIVDGNIARVLMRLLNDTTPIDSPAGIKLLWERAEVLVQAATHPSNHNAALMELGQTHCRPGVPDCKGCPVKSFCAAADPASLPVKQKKIELTEVTERVSFRESDKGIWLEQETGSRRTGLWRFPKLEESKPLPPVLYKGTYGITRYRVTLWVHECPCNGSDKADKSDTGRWVALDDLSALAMPSPYRRALNAVLKNRRFSLTSG
jgi:A/G-specific adenine glycosylase